VTRRKWRITRVMAVPANWQGTPEHFYHFLLGYFVPLVLWQERSGASEVAVRDCGPMNAWFDLLRPGTDVEMMPPGVMLERVLSHRQERVILHDWDNPTRFHRRSLDEFTQAVLPRAVGNASPSSSSSAGPTPRITLLERRPNPEYYHSGAAETPGGGSEWRSVPNIDDIADALAPLGDVRIVDTAELEPRDQVRTIHDTDLLIAQHGAGLANLVWLPSGTGVIELLPPLPPTIDTIFRNLAAARRVGYRAVDQSDLHAAVDPRTVVEAASIVLTDPLACVPTATGSLPMRLLRQGPRRL
jgi:Glycosyltransferase 61